MSAGFEPKQNSWSGLEVAVLHFLVRGRTEPGSRERRDRFKITPQAGRSDGVQLGPIAGSAAVAPRPSAILILSPRPDRRLARRTCHDPVVTTRYVGSGPYCYANSLAMVFGDGVEPGLIEVLTGSPFGFELIAGVVPLFDPLGWDPGIGIDAAIELLGWRCERSDGGDAGAALTRVRAAIKSGPVLVGPLEIGLLLHHPEPRGAIGSDHFVIISGLEGDIVRFHDPHGYPYATMQTDPFAVAWRADSIPYADVEYRMWSGFQRERVVPPLQALRTSLPSAAAWLAEGQPERVPPGSLGGRKAALAFAEMVEAGLRPDRRAGLVWFAVRVGARRLADAEYWLGQIGLAEASAIAGTQSRIVGSLQYPLVTEDDATAATLLRELAPTYGALAKALKT